MDATLDRTHGGGRPFQHSVTQVAKFKNVSITKMNIDETADFVDDLMGGPQDDLKTKLDQSQMHLVDNVSEQHQSNAFGSVNGPNSSKQAHSADQNGGNNAALVKAKTTIRKRDRMGSDIFIGDTPDPIDNREMRRLQNQDFVKQITSTLDVYKRQIKEDPYYGKF